MIISQTPLRISFLGGGTDFHDYFSQHGGMVLTTTIDKYVFVILNERYDEQIVINYSKKEVVSSVDEIKHELVREAMRKTGVTGGIEITMIADIPAEGTGLGSSSSLTVGLLNALYMLTGQQVTAEQLAREACEIEIERCKKPIGLQDQYIAAYGGLCSIRFSGDENVTISKIGLSDNQLRTFRDNFILFYSGITRKSEEILKEQKSGIPAITGSLTSLKRLAAEGDEALRKNDYSSFGKLLDESWSIKKQLATSISNPEIDNMYEVAKNAGALGGKILGAGGGGFLLLFATQGKHEPIRKALKNYREMPFLFEKDGSKIIFNYRRYSWK
jgi:D-glycero-alpha-D-manno-heptose-7-phosphate kinase